MGGPMLVSLLLAFMERNLRGKNSDSIPAVFNGTELFVWEKKNPDRREGGTIELVLRCASTPGNPDYAHHKSNSGNAL
ncbi:hypothetical protein BCON_0008g01000 [Botryotinia convoluta]|uniref:Uncharacterized protein n=1 Tax=Botryotinia convoluta TaxID=54673 RepID=A0A4Z1IXL8_9HELO|nr:hypothetical protein BCON_0008g01000 [Botryotinia convoluta]